MLHHARRCTRFTHATRSAEGWSLITPLHGACRTAAPGRVTGVAGFPHRSRAQRHSPIKVRGRLLKIRRRARPRLPRVKLPAQHGSPHLVGYFFATTKRLISVSGLRSIAPGVEPLSAHHPRLDYARLSTSGGGRAERGHRVLTNVAPTPPPSQLRSAKR